MLVLKNPTSSHTRIAQVKSSLLGWSPPSSHGMRTSASTPTVPPTSFSGKEDEPTTFTKARIRAAVSRFAATSTRLSNTNNNLVQIGSRTTRVSESPRGIV